jgi:transitional endoplasmic reticulum ATPase
MPTPGSDLRGDGTRRSSETVTFLGARVVIVDGAATLAAAKDAPVVLLRGASYPAPVQEVRFRLEPGQEADRAVLRMVADLRTGGFPPAHLLVNSAMLGAVAPVGALIARGLADRGPVASRIAAGAEAVATAPTRLLRSVWPPLDDEVTGDPIAEAAAVGLVASITYDGAPAASSLTGGRLPLAPRTVAVRATVPVDEVTPVHLRAMVLLVLRVVADLAGGTTESLRGRSYVVGGRSPAPPPLDLSDEVTLDQVGGLREVVDQFREIAVSFRHPEIMARWGARRPQGILLYGPPGTGKTMLARALANEIGATFREIRTPEILDKWLGASERNIKQIFQEARRYREPTVMLFDEFDSIISYAGAGGDAASQAVNAVAGIFKQEMNGLIEANPNVIVVATTNFPHRVDDSLIRSGRFDIKLKIPLPDEAGRAEIITKKIRELIDRHEVDGFRMFAGDVDPAALAAASHGMTGADIKEVLRRVQLAKAMQEARGGPSEPITHDDLARTIAALRR